MELGKLNGAVNFAGVTNKTMGKPEGGIEVMDQDEWDFCIRINLTGVMQCLRAEIPQFADDGGFIVNAASTLGLTGHQYGAAYAVNKHGCIVRADKISHKGSWGKEHTGQLSCAIC